MVSIAKLSYLNCWLYARSVCVACLVKKTGRSVVCPAGMSLSVLVCPGQILKVIYLDPEVLVNQRIEGYV